MSKKPRNTCILGVKGWKCNAVKYTFLQVSWKYRQEGSEKSWGIENPRTKPLFQLAFISQIFSKESADLLILVIDFLAENKYNSCTYPDKWNM